MLGGLPQSHPRPHSSQRVQAGYSSALGFAAPRRGDFGGAAFDLLLDTEGVGENFLRCRALRTCVERPWSRKPGVEHVDCGVGGFLGPLMKAVAGAFVEE